MIGYVGEEGEKVQLSLDLHSIEQDPELPFGKMWLLFRDTDQRLVLLVGRTEKMADYRVGATYEISARVKKLGSLDDEPATLIYYARLKQVSAPRKLAYDGRWLGRVGEYTDLGPMVLLGATRDEERGPALWDKAWLHFEDESGLRVDWKVDTDIEARLRGKAGQRRKAGKHPGIRLAGDEGDPDVFIAAADQQGWAMELEHRYTGYGRVKARRVVDGVPVTEVWYAKLWSLEPDGSLALDTEGLPAEVPKSRRAAVTER